MKAILSTLALTFLLAAPAAAAGAATPGTGGAALCSAPSAASLQAPEPVPAAGPCYVREYCDGGGYVECWGPYPSSTCSAGPEYVVCDGQRKECPCQASLTCYGGNVISCTGGGAINECEVGPYWVNCNERVTYCPVTCTAQCEGGFPRCNGYNGQTCFTKYGHGSETFYIRCDGRQIDCDELEF